MPRTRKRNRFLDSTAIRIAAWTTGCLLAVGSHVSSSTAFANDVANSDASIAPVATAAETPVPTQPASAQPIVPMVTAVYPAGDATGTVCEPTKEPLFGLIAPSDAAFSNFISPISNPIFFEDPRTLTEAKFIFLNHQLPASLGGNNVQVYALQLRAAITDRLSIIATKDGYIVSENALMEDGWANLSAGLKYNVYKDASAQQILSVGATFQLPTGSLRTLQGNGDGEFDLFAAGGMQIGECWHLISTTGFRLACDRNDQTDSWYWSNHIDRKLTSWGLYALYEVNWYHWLRSSGAFPAPVDGLDVLNLGAKGVAGNNVVTNAIGVKYAPSINQEIGIAYEFPLSSDKDIMQDRINFNWIFRY